MEETWPSHRILKKDNKKHLNSLVYLKYMDLELEIARNEHLNTTKIPVVIEALGGLRKKCWY